MYKNILELKTKDRCNYVIEISPNNNNIFLSLNEQGYILPKEDFLLLDEQKLNTINNSKIPISLFNLEDTISNAKFTSDNKNIFIYDYINNKILKEIENKNKFVYSFCFLSNNKLATGNSNGSIYIYDIETYNKENKIEEHCLLVRNLAFNNNKNILYSASDDLHINQIDTNTLKLDSPMVGHKEPISDMVYNEKKKILITSSFDGTIKVWDVNGKNNCVDTLVPSNKNPIWDITVSEEGDFIAYTATEGIGAFTLK